MLDLARSLLQPPPLLLPLSLLSASAPRSVETRHVIVLILGVYGAIIVAVVAGYQSHDEVWLA